jgi:hypothetical protein
MGASGVGIRADDLVCDVVGRFEAGLKAGQSTEISRQRILKDFEDALADPDDGPLVWIGLAEAQWTYGAADPDVVARVKADVDRGVGLQRWSEISPKLEAKRKAVLADFVAKVGAPNPRPRKPPRLVVRPPKFAPGDCLGVKLQSGEFAAALVLAADASNPEYGRNLVGVLDWIGAQAPVLRDFDAPKWLRLTHHKWNGRLDVSWYQTQSFRAAKGRVSVVGSRPVDGLEAPESNTFSSWANLGRHVVLQRDWNRDGARSDA